MEALLPSFWHPHPNPRVEISLAGQLLTEDPPQACSPLPPSLNPGTGRLCRGIHAARRRLEPPALPPSLPGLPRSQGLQNSEGLQGIHNATPRAASKKAAAPSLTGDTTHSTPQAPDPPYPSHPTTPTVNKTQTPGVPSPLYSGCNHLTGLPLLHLQTQVRILGEVWAAGRAVEQPQLARRPPAFGVSP